MTGPVVAPMALLGSGEFEPWASDGERLLLSLAAGDGSVAILPLASAPEGETYADWAHKGLTHFEELRIPARVVEVKERGDAFKQELIVELERVSVIYFSGGNPAFLADAVAGTPLGEATHDPIGATSPAWSPDGTTIAYVGNSGVGYGKLFVLDVATGESTKVSDELAASPSFTPDGSSLLYSRGTEYPLGLRTVPIAGGQSRLLFGAGEGIIDSGNGAISPDGSLVTFLSGDTPPTGEAKHCGPCRLLANADGTNRQVITGWMGNPAGTWSPDGSRIVAMEQLENQPQVIVVVDVATEEATIVAYGRAAIWLDDRTVLVEV